MGVIDYKAIYDRNKFGWHDMTESPEQYEALLAGHYSDSNHFVYELLQNAEDAGASKVVIEYYKDKLIFYHNGKPFDENDVCGVSSMLKGTKDKSSGQTIGRFGMGFKSVFKYTYLPVIYSDEEAFRIENYLLPVEITENIFSPDAEKKALNERMKGNGGFVPFLESDHITKIIIPFWKKDEDGNLYDVPGKDVLEKLNSLNGEILLFLTHIRNLFWIDIETKHHAMITLKEQEADARLVTCRIVGTGYGAKDEVSKYLKYKSTFDHSKMSDAEVSVAYRLNNRGDNINEMKDTDIWVFFPTRDNTKLPFLIHGSFETAVSREKLMTPSDFNNYLFDKLGDLITYSMTDLRDRKLITQVFIRRTLIQAFKDEEENGTIPGLKEKITKVFLKEAIFPNRLGEYARAKELRIPVPFEIGNHRDNSLFAPCFENVPRFVAFNNEKESNFTEYYLWLTNDLKVKQFSLIELAHQLVKLHGVKIASGDKKYNLLLEFYRFLAVNTKKVYDTGLGYSRSGPYEAAIRSQLDKAWKILKEAPIILNEDDELVPAYVNGQEMVYLQAKSDYKKMISSSIVKRQVMENYRSVLEDGFEITEFDNFQYVKEKILRKYASDCEDINFDDNDDFMPEYIEDIRQLVSLISSVESTSERNSIREMAEDAYIIKLENAEDLFEKPGNVCMRTSDEGIDLSIYWAPMQVYEDDGIEDFGVSLIDEQFYIENGIPLSELAKLGVWSTPFIPGERSHDGVGDGHWRAQGEYCPAAEIDGAYENIDYIMENPDEELAKKKSAELLRLALLNARKMKGYVKYRKNNPYEQEEEAKALQALRYDAWLYGEDGKLHCIGELSKYELDKDIYGEILPNKEVYVILGFAEKKSDAKADTFAMVESMDKRDQMILLRQLARKLGKSITDSGDAWEDEDNGMFVLDAWVDRDFPIHRVYNVDNLIRHVRESFFCADPITYKEVLRSIRVSKSKSARSYVTGMYTNEGKMKLCQICMEPSDNIEATEIANYGMELSQMNLCLCTNCARNYKNIRDVNKEDFKKKMKEAIKGLDSREDADTYDVILDDNMTIHFTQTHLMEIQTLFQLIDEYGLPGSVGSGKFENSKKKNKAEIHAIASGSFAGKRRSLFDDESEKDVLEVESVADEEIAITEENGGSYFGIADESEIVIEKGSFVTYRKPDGSLYENEIQPDKFPLHKAFMGKKIGEKVNFGGRNYVIIEIL